jgi:hypothetical protein
MNDDGFDFELDPMTGRPVVARRDTLVQMGLNTNLVRQIAREEAARNSGGGTTLPDQTGNAGKFLKTDGSATSWANPTASVTYVVVSKSADYMIGSEDVIKVTAAGVVITLPDATTATVKPITIKNSSSGNIQLSTTGVQTVDNSTSAILIPNQSLTVISDGNGWIII